MELRTKKDIFFDRSWEQYRFLFDIRDNSLFTYLSWIVRNLIKNDSKQSWFPWTNFPSDSTEFSPFDVQINIFEICIFKLFSLPVTIKIFKYNLPCLYLERLFLHVKILCSSFSFFFLRLFWNWLFRSLVDFYHSFIFEVHDASISFKDHYHLEVVPTTNSKVKERES